MNNRYILERLRSAWNVFLDRNPKEEVTTVLGPAYTIPQFKKRFRYGNEKSIVNAIYTRIAVDVSMVTIQHVRVDENKVYLETIDSGLNKCITEEANIDQTAKAFIEDAVMSMVDEGTVALVPTDTSVSLVNQNAFDILSMRTAKVVQWYPHHVRLLVYNDNRGEKEEITLHKSKVAIIENPFYSIMNEPNGILMRLVEKLNLLDFIDQQSGSGKLDLIIQLPYIIKSKARQEQADQRRKDIETQLKDSKYGIAYTDGTEKITQLNRPAENNLMAQIEYFTDGWIVIDRGGGICMCDFFGRLLFVFESNTERDDRLVLRLNGLIAMSKADVGDLCAGICTSNNKTYLDNLAGMDEFVLLDQLIGEDRQGIDITMLDNQTGRLTGFGVVELAVNDNAFGLGFEKTIAENVGGFLLKMSPDQGNALSVHMSKGVRGNCPTVSAFDVGLRGPATKVPNILF